jgi:hypothetical protein
LYYSQVLKQLIKPSQAYEVDWLIKDLVAWDAICEWWASTEFKAISE